jgi:membrane associated rhomboid family serine protease
MSIYDRDYMGCKEWRPGSSGSRYSAAVILIVLNSFVWLVWQFARTNPGLNALMWEHFTASPEGLLGHLRLHTMLTSAISHMDLLHFLFNMLFFWFMAQDVEAIYGRGNLFVLYAVAGIAGSLAQIGLEVATLGQAWTLGPPVLGASGAVMGVAVVAAILDPNKPMLIFGIIPIALKWLVVLFLAVDVLGALDRGGHVAYAAHLGGALTGFLFWKFDLRVFGWRRGSGAFINRVKMWLMAKPRLRILQKKASSNNELSRPQQFDFAYNEDDASTFGTSRTEEDVDADTARRVDQLLDKISRSGLDALTEEERLFLKESSLKYRVKKRN